MRSGIDHATAAARAQARCRRLLKRAADHEEHARNLYEAGLHDAAELALDWGQEAIGKALRAHRLERRLRAAALKEVRRG